MAFAYVPQRLQVDERGRAHGAAVRLVGPIADDVEAQLAARRLDVLVRGVRHLLAQVPLHAAGAQRGTGHAVLQRLLAGDHADADRALPPNRVLRQQPLVLVDAPGHLRDELAHAVDPAVGRLLLDAADADVAGHHARARGPLEEVEDLLTLAEAVEEHRHGTQLERTGAQPP